MDSFLVGYDYYYLYSATALWAHGANPYDAIAFANQLKEIGWPASEGVQGLTHPPTTELFALPFVFFPFAIAKWMWMGFVSLLIGLTGWWVYENKALRKLHGFREPLPYILSLVAFPPVLSNVIWGQHNAIPLIGLIGCLAFLSSRQGALAGLLLSLTTLKPHLLIPFYVFLFGHALLAKRPAILAGFSAGVALQCALTWIINPRSFSNYFEAVSKIGSDSVAILGASPTQLLAVFTHEPKLAVILLGSACAFALVLLFRNKYSFDRLVLFFLPLSIAVSPYVWNHSFILLLVPYLNLMSRGFERFGPRFRFAVAAIGAVGVFIGLMATLNPYTSLFPLALVAVYFLPRKSHSAHLTPLHA